MIKPLRFSFAAMSIALVSIPVMAQSAPIRVGPGGSTYTSPQDLQSQIARQTADMGRMEARISQLMGRIEDTELRLANTERDYESAVEENRKLNDKLADLTGRMEKVESQRATAQRETNSSSPFEDAQSGNRGVTDLRGGAQSSQSAGGYSSGSSGPFQNSGSGRVISTIPSDTADRSSSQGRLPEGTLGTLPVSQAPNDAGPLFEQGKNRLLNFDYDGAEKAFRAFLDEFSDDPQAGEAHYWLGEVLYQQGDFAGSASFLTAMLKDYPNDPRRGEALVKLARSLREVGEPARACAFLSRLDQVDPNASAVTKNLARVEQQRSKCE